MKKNKTFYDNEYTDDIYANIKKAEDHSHFVMVQKFIDKNDLKNKKCLEIGCGRGAFQNMVEDYTGFDISSIVKKYHRKNFFSGSAEKLPFKDNSFNALWTINVLEHIIDPEKALMEMRRVLKPGGMLYLAAAWHCRSWAADGYPVRPYKDFNIKGKTIKFSIIFRNAKIYLALKYIIKRLFIMLRFNLFDRKKILFRHKKIKANFDHFWMSDSDAVNNMDQLHTIYWFVSRKDNCLNCNSFIEKLTHFQGQLIFKINK